MEEISANLQHTNIKEWSSTRAITIQEVGPFPRLTLTYQELNNFHQGILGKRQSPRVVLPLS